MKREFLGEETFPLTFGGAAISGEGGGYGFGEISERDSCELLEMAYEKGVRVFDSAPIYGFGLSEIRMGKGLRSVREKVKLISKSGVDWHSNQRVNMTNDPKVTEKMLMESLKRFNTEYIDLYMIHWPDEKVDIRKTLEVLERFKEKEVIRHIGLCNTNIEELNKAKEVCHVEVAQSEYHFFNRSIENDLGEFFKENKVDFMSWGTLDKGILTGKYKVNKHFDESDCRRSAPWWKKSDIEKKLELIEEAREFISDEYRFIDLAIAFNLSNESVKSVLIGSRNFAQLESSVETIKRSDEVIKNFPHWEKVKNIFAKFYE